MVDIKGKVACVTGSAQGIGLAIALRLAQHGSDMALVDISGDGLREAARQIETLGVRALPLIADVADMEQVEAAVERIINELGGMDVLVNNAGWSNFSPFVNTQTEERERVIAVNLGGTMNFSKAVLPHMIKKKAGKIINIGSTSAMTGAGYLAAYAASKGGVVAFTKSLAREVARYGINVNCVCPGSTNTQLYAQIPQKIRALFLQNIPFGRIAEPEEIADAVLFFSSSLSDYITGQTLNVDGGNVMM